MDNSFEGFKKWFEGLTEDELAAYVQDSSRTESDSDELAAFLKEYTAKEPVAIGRPLDAVPTPKYDPAAAPALLRVIQQNLKPIVKRHWCSAHFMSHPLGAKASGPKDFEVVCCCKWRVYYGDATVLPKAVQDTFSWVTRSKLWLKLLCLGHAILHVLFLRTIDMPDTIVHLYGKREEEIAVTAEKAIVERAPRLV